MWYNKTIERQVISLKNQKEVDIMEKMTNKKALQFVLDNCIVPDEVQEKLVKMIEQLDKKSSNPKKPTKAQIENEGYMELILNAMTAEGQTVSELMKTIPEFEDFSNQKVAALVKKLVDAEKIVKTVEKGRSYFSKVE